MEKKKLLTKRICLIIIFLIAFIPRMDLVLQAVPLRTLSDELSTINGAALFAGYDWSAVVSQCGYYGFGFYALCAPFFHIFEDPILIYRAILTVGTLAQAVTVLICFHLCERYFGFEENYFLISLVSIVCNYAVVTRTDIAYNEHPLILIFWIVTWLVCLYLEKRRNKTLLILYGVLFYSLTIHTRALLMFLAVTVLLLWDSAAKRQYRRNLEVCLLAGIAFVLGKSACKLYQNAIWTDANVIRNAEYKANLSNLDFGLTTIQAWLDIVLGQLTSINLVLCGGAVLSVVSVLWFLRKNVEGNEEKEYIISIFFICFVCIGGTIFAQSLSWLRGVSKTLSTEYYYAYYAKALTYVRYFGPYVGVAVLCGLAAFFKQKQKQSMIIAVSFAVDVLLLRFWMAYIMKYVFHNIYATEIFWPFGKVTSSEQVYSSFVYHAFLTAGAIGILLLLLLMVKENRIFLLVLAAALLYQYRYLGVYNDLQTQQENYSKVEQICLAAKDLEKQDQIYVYDGSEEKTNQLSFLYQMCFYDAKVIIGLPEQDYEGYLFSNVMVDDKLLGYSYECQQLGEEQYLYTIK